jgi:SnoaL-like domain
MKFASLIGALLWGFAVTTLAVAQASPDATLDALHQAGVDANPAAFTALLAQDVVFLGVDGAARLEGPSAREFFGEHLLQANTWTYRSSDRDMRLSPDGSVAWFDETLEHDQLGRGRGTGVLIRSSGGWKLAQYNLSVPRPGGAGSAAGVQPADAQQKKRCMITSHKTNTRADC